MSLNLDTIKTVDTQPFRYLVSTIGNLPTSFTESMTYYEMMAWLIKFIEDNVIPTVNNNAAAVEELQAIVIELHDYVEHYFDNLDVQEEINNKLDAMVEDGTMEQIIRSAVLTDFQYVKYIMPKSHTHSGDYNIIQTDNKNILIDCYAYDDWNEFKAVIDSYGITTFDIFICTHFHPDHIGNFKNLVDNGYITSDTTIYFPKYTQALWESDSSWTDEHGYREAIQTIEDNDLTTIQPTEGMVVTINSNVDFTFYNADDAISRQLFDQESYYNNASLIIKFRHNTNYIMYWGDCYSEPVEWLYDQGKVPSNIVIWKLGHHGVDYANNTYFDVLRKLTVNYGVIECGRDNLSKGNIYTNGGGSSFQRLNIPVLVSAYNSKNIEFSTCVNNISLVQGTYDLTAEKSRFKTITFYVDSTNYSPSKQDGSSTYPFSNLAQCLGNIDKDNSITYTINLADGTYNDFVASYYQERNLGVLYGVTNRIIIKGNSSDSSAVVLKNGFNIINCSNVTIQDLTINNSGNFAGIEVNHSKVYLKNIVYSKVSGSNNQVAIKSDYSDVYIDNVSVDEATHGIKGAYSNLYINTLHMTNLGYQGLNVKKCYVDATDCSVTDNSKNLVVNDNNNYKSSFGDGIELWSGSKAYDPESEDNTITLNTANTVFNALRIDYITDSNRRKSLVIPMYTTTQTTRINEANSNETYQWIQQLILSFDNSTTLKLGGARQYRFTLASMSGTPTSSTSNITLTRVVGL